MVSISEKKFEFGKNWSKFLNELNENRIHIAENTLIEKLASNNLEGKKFLDVGCGSGLFSLAARRLGAQVVSFDYDQDSVNCAQTLKHRFFPHDTSWFIYDGSALDHDFLKSLGQFDIVYSWGVLHHTGNMWKALALVDDLVSPQGKLFISLYNDQGRTSRLWLRIKKIYNNFPPPLRFLILFPCFIRLWGPSFLRDVFKGQSLYTWKNYSSDRGMSPWRDVVDWVGGYPFEVSKPEEIFNFFRERGYLLRSLKTMGGGLGCNEFVFTKCSVQNQPQIFS